MARFMVYLKGFSIMYTTMYFFFQKCKLNWKEKYLNFVIEYHFNDHFLEKINSSTWFMNEFFFNGWYNNK